MSASTEQQLAKGTNAATEDLPEREEREDFETQRVIAACVKKLLGRGELLRIGRFPVVGRIGAGGMGVVYRCYDDVLDRAIAVKLVQPHARANEREARALARVSHENVVQVYDSGEHDGQIFIAMEFIEGTTLRGVFEGPEMGWRDKLVYYLAAGRGLAAMHEVGVVHRDFKPDNVLVGNDGHVRVADFGLALLDGATLDSSADAALSTARVGIVSVAGAVQGTPSYMAPEQLRGESADSRSDQFSFCASVYEAMWNKLPFGGRTVVAQLEARTRGELERPPNNRALYRVLARGLRSEPAERWPSMGVLLARLEALSKRRTRWWRGVAVALAAGSTFSAGELARPQLTVCELDTGPWNADVREKVESQATAAAALGQTWVRIESALSAWSKQWNEQRDLVCAELEQWRPAPEARVRAACLEYQRIWASALIGGLADAPPHALLLFVDSVEELSEPSECLRGYSRAPLPPGSIEAEQVWTMISRSHVRRLLGHRRQALDLALEAESDAVAIGHTPLLAEARGELAKVHEELGNVDAAFSRYESALGLARDSQQHVLAADLALELGDMLLKRKPAVEIGRLEAHIERCAVDVERTGLVRLKARLEYLYGQLAIRRGALAQADTHYDRALELIDHRGAGAPAYLSAKAEATDDRARAIEFRRRALDAAIAHFGVFHPRTAAYIYSYGLELPKGEAQTRELERAVGIWGDLSADVLRSRDLVLYHSYLAKRALLAGYEAEEAQRQQKFEQAREHAVEAQRVYERSSRAVGPEHADVLLLRAQIEAVARNYEQALTYARAAKRSYRGREPQHPRDAREIDCHFHIVNQLLALERLDEVLSELDELSAHHGDVAGIDARATFVRAELLVRRGDTEGAAQALAALEVEQMGSSVMLLQQLVALRMDKLDAAELDAFHRELEQGAVSKPELQVWLDELGVSPAEREALRM